MQDGKSFDNIDGKKYSRAFHEFLFIRESKNTKTLLSFGLGLLMVIGFFNLKESISSFPENLKEIKEEAKNFHFSLSELSEEMYKITLIPHNLYFALKEVSDFYEGELHNFYLTLGNYINSEVPKASSNLVTFLSDPSFHILENVKRLSVAEVNFVDENLALIMEALTPDNQIVQSSRYRTKGR